MDHLPRTGLHRLRVALERVHPLLPAVGPLLLTHVGLPLAAILVLVGSPERELLLTFFGGCLVVGALAAGVVHGAFDRADRR